MTEVGIFVVKAILKPKNPKYNTALYYATDKTKNTTNGLINTIFTANDIKMWTVEDNTLIMKTTIK